MGGLREVQFNFAVASTSWPVPHGLNTLAIEVNCFEADGLTEKECEVTFIDANNLLVEWYYPEAGIVRLLY